MIGRVQEPGWAEDRCVSCLSFEDSVFISRHVGALRALLLVPDGDA
jgi:hypothetical protein